MHMRADRTGDVVTRRWAGVAGIVSGLVGVGISGLLAWAVAPLGSPVIAVGELIIELLPAPLVNFGKETLGYADKPVLLVMVVAAVLLLCGLAGRVELRRRFAGAAVFALVAVLGLIGVSAQPGASPTAYVPTLVGLLLGYIILNTLITKLRYWRPRHGAEDAGADSAARRNFLGWTLVVGVIAAAAAVGGQLLASAATAANNARERIRLPLAKQPAPPVPAGAELNIPDLTPYVSANDNFYRIDTALQVPVIDPEKLDVEDHRTGGSSAGDRLRHAQREAPGRAHGHLDLRLQRGRRPTGRQCPLARLPDP